MPPHQTLTALVCVALLGCAEGVDDFDWAGEPIVNGVPILDAGAGAPGLTPGLPVTNPVGWYDAGSGPGATPPVVVVVVVNDAATGGAATPDSSGSGQGGTATDAAVGQPSNPGPTDAGSPTRDASTAPAPTDAGTAPKPVDAGYTPPEAGPMCQAATCTNYCGLARRCCNASNQCACMSLFGTCSLPSLRP